MESYEILWKVALPKIETKVSTIFYLTSIPQLTPVDIVGNKLVLITPTETFKNTVINNLEAVKGIKNGLKESSEDIDDFTVVVAQNKQEYDKSIEGANLEAPVQSSNVNPKLTFESFVVGSSNEFMYAAAKAVAENPGEAYNPLFVYGGTGLGKTHILMAIANYLKRHNPSLNVLYVTCEQFTNQMIESISKGKSMGTIEFHKKFRNVDMLLVDDVQFLAKKQGTQEEFFNMFNELINKNKHIVLASDRPPKEIEGLAERLRTRFEGGLLADVGLPDLETRIAILKKKAEEQKTVVDIKVLSYMAESHGDADIRTLIGKLTKVVFASKLHEKPITIALVNEALKESVSEKEEELQVDDIINCVCQFYKVNKNDILSKKKTKEISEPRQICAYLITEMMNLPLMTIGEKLGGRDHATIIYARDKVAEEIKNNHKLSTEISDIRKMILKQ